MYSYFMHMSLVYTLMLFVCHSYVLVCHSSATRICIYSCVICMSLVCCRMSLECARISFVGICMSLVYFYHGPLVGHLKVVPITLVKPKSKMPSLFIIYQFGFEVERCDQSEPHQIKLRNT